MAILFPFGNRWIPKSDNGRFVCYIADIIVYIDDRLRLEWKPVLATGQKPAINIPLLVQQCLDHYRINPQKLDARLYRTYTHIVGRLTEVVWEIPASVEPVRNNTDRFIRHFTDCVLKTNRMIEEWKLQYEKKGPLRMDARDRKIYNNPYDDFRLKAS